MKKLTKEEVSKLDFMEPKSEPVFEEVSTLEVGEGLFIAITDWNRKTSVRTAIGNRFTNWKFKSKKDEYGTFIIRIK